MEERVLRNESPFIFAERRKMFMTYEDRTHTCGRCQYENIPDEEYPCNRCIWSEDVRQDLWAPKKSEEVEE